MIRFSEVQRTTNPRIIERWLRECDKRSGQNLIAEDSFYNYAESISVDCRHVCLHIEDKAFCAFVIEDFPYKIVTATPFCLVSSGAQYLRSLFAAFENEALLCGARMFRLFARDEKLMRVLSKRFPGNVEYAGVILRSV